ncbi:MAG: hypothetical protein JSV36_10145, partial [Anaerolineae bacterium]
MDKRARTALLILSLLLLTLLSTVAWAGRSDHYAVDWQVLSAGGAPAVSGSGHVALNGTLGQTAIGPATNGVVTLGAGYWYGLGERIFQIYLPL